MSNKNKFRIMKTLRLILFVLIRLGWLAVAILFMEDLKVLEPSARIGIAIMCLLTISFTELEMYSND